MKIICTSNINPTSGIQEDESWISVGKEYMVLELSKIDTDKVIEYSIIGNSSETPIVVDSNSFKVSDPRMPSNWVLKYNDSSLRIGPRKWLDNSLWKYSFWEDYWGDESEEAEKVYEEEMQKMVDYSEFKKSLETNDPYQAYVKQLVNHLIRDAKIAKQEYLNTTDKEKKIFNDGVLLGYYYAISLFKQQAEICRIDHKDLNLDDINPDEDLLVL